ncbi:MAG: hypothetical protein OEQ39_17115, partial [Gammaproteobacteria bacterium]|nr:hypothetical protein [Gammaproteobacteria bacterium]
FFRAVSAVKDHRRFATWPLAGLRCIIPGFMVSISATAGELPCDMGVVATGLFVVLLLDLSFGNRATSIIVRGIVYVSAVFTVYLGIAHTPELLREHEWWMTAFFGAIIVAIAVTVRFDDREILKPTPLDYLIVCAVIGVVIVDTKGLLNGDFGVMAVQAIVLVYGCEVLLSTARRRWTVLNIASLISMGLVSARGLM